MRKIFALMTVLAFTVFCAENAVASNSQPITKIENVKGQKKGRKNKVQEKKAQIKKLDQKKNLKKKGKK